MIVLTLRDASGYVATLMTASDLKYVEAWRASQHNILALVVNYGTLLIFTLFDIRDRGKFPLFPSLAVSI